MSRDTDRELARLEKLLAQEEEEKSSQPDAQEETPDDYDDLPPVVCRVRNTDRTDTDLDDYSHTVYEPPEKKGGCCLSLAVVMLVGVALALALLALKLGGLWK